VDTLLLKNLNVLDAKEKEFYTNVRVMCAKAIANYRDTSAVTPLLYCLNNKDENYKVRFACADALGRIGDKYAVAPLIDVVKDEEEKSVYLRESAASALGMLGDMRAVDPLVSILETKQGIIDKFTFLKERVIEALGKLRLSDNERVFNALKMTLMDPSPQIRINAIEAIMDSEHSESYDVIKTCLLDDDDEVKKNALVALYNMQGRSVLDEVIREPLYSDILKMEAVSMIDEYETDEDAEFAEKFKEELDG
ncbi:HEAT repeat domain-containing protein, partial [bacterium]|nr:HEAT repeat domain-containing protein [bacterium]